MLGQKLVFGFHGKTLPEEFKNLLREYKIGNVILFLRNVESAEQLRSAPRFNRWFRKRRATLPLSSSTRRAAW